jgi:single-stranded DNA-binding protein
MHEAELTAFCSTTQEHVMSFVRIEQRNARLAQAVKLDQIKGREGLVTKGTVVVLSNVRKGEGRDDEVTSILWTLWGKQAENAAEYLGKGSRVNVVGRPRKQQLRGQGRTGGLRPHVHLRGDRLPRQQGRVAGAAHEGAGRFGAGAEPEQGQGPQGCARLKRAGRGAEAPRL